MLFILLLKLSQFWSFKTLSKWLLCPIYMPHPSQFYSMSLFSDTIEYFGGILYTLCSSPRTGEKRITERTYTTDS